MDPDKISRLRIDREEQFVPKGSRKRRTIGIICLLLVAIVGLYLAFHHGLLTPTVQVRTTSVNWVYPAQVITEFNASGYVVAQRKAAVASKGTGRLIYLGVQEGSRVKEGDIVAKIESDDLVAERAQTEAQLSVVRSDLIRAETEVRTAERNNTRFTDLYDRKAVSQLDFENAQDRYLKAKAALESAKFAVKALEANVRRLTVLIEYTVIRAPFDGVVLTKDADVGEVVAPFGSANNAKAAVVNMADLASLMVQADVAESFLSKVRVGQACEIQLDSLPDIRFRGTVDTIVPTADRTRGTVMVKVRFDRLDPRVLPEMSARAAFLSRPLDEGETRPFLAVHHDAATTRNGEPGVFRIENARAVWVPLSGAENVGDYVLVDSKMQNADRVVLKPSSDLKAGDKVGIAE